jgi:hypothetical protein
MNMLATAENLESPRFLLSLRSPATSPPSVRYDGKCLSDFQIARA